MISPKINLQILNDDLIAAAKPESPKKPSTPKRNTKDELVERIIKVAEEGGVPLQESDTKLRRMNKSDLRKKLAEVTSAAVRNQMCESVKAKPGSCDSALGLAALRMMHDLVAYSTEKGANMFLPKYGYEMSGFVECLKDDTVREATDAAILEIANDSELMGYVDSPYIRLLIAWSGAMIKSIKRKKNASEMGSEQDN